jgi:hydrogenase-4 component A
MTKFVIADPKLCIGCYTCMPACVVVHQEAGLQAFPRLHVTHTPHGTMPMQCRHCEDAPCAKACPAGCFAIGETVQLNEGLCIGCKMCVLACPFGVIEPHGTGTQNLQMPLDAYFAADGATLPYAPPPVPEAPAVAAPLGPLLSWTAGVRTIAVKCDVCYFREEGPACIQVCPTKALSLVEHRDMEDLNAEKRQRSIESAKEIVALQPART